MSWSPQLLPRVGLRLLPKVGHGANEGMQLSPERDGTSADKKLLLAPVMDDTDYPPTPHCWGATNHSWYSSHRDLEKAV